MKILISKQTEAEKDDYLLDCFYDSGVVRELVESKYTVLSGRKGAGKTAIIRYLEAKHDQYAVDYVIRLSIRGFNTDNNSDKRNTLTAIIMYIAVKTAKRLLEDGMLQDESKKYWNDFFTINGLQAISDYESFMATKKTSKRSLRLKLSTAYMFFKGEANTNNESKKETERTQIAATPGNLLEALKQSFPKDKKCLIFIDDISDYLDESESTNIKRDIGIIQDLLLRMQTFNLDLIDSGYKSRIISLVRDDLFEFMEGSNTGKIKSDTLALQWNEKDFASLLIKRMDILQGNLQENLKDPISTIKKWFPDEIFTELLKDFETNRYSYNFYAYMAAITFNRPRDFLQFCYALRDRLSSKHPATKQNIESAEIEFTDYLELELRNELFIASKVFDYDLTSERINFLVRIMTKKDKFNYSELKAELSKFFKEKKVGHKKVEELLYELWKYGVIGIKDKKDLIIRFKYLSKDTKLYADKLKTYRFYLHRGLWWFSKKYKH